MEAGGSRLSPYVSEKLVTLCCEQYKKDTAMQGVRENPEGQLSSVAHPSENKPTHIRKALTSMGPYSLVF